MTDNEVSKRDKIIAAIIVLLLFIVCFMAHFNDKKETPQHETTVQEIELR